MPQITITATEPNSVDYCIRTSLSILGCLKYSDIKVLMEETYGFDCIIVSKISVLNTETIKAIDNSLEMMADNYVDKMKQKVQDINDYTLPSANIDIYKSIVDSVTLSALKYMDQLQKVNDISVSILDLSDTLNTTEQNLQKQEDISVDIFNFIESKNLMNSTLSSLKYDSDKLKELVSSEATTYITFISNTQDIINKYCSLLQDTINMDIQAQQIIDACKLALYIQGNTCNASQEKLEIFLARKYQDIKQDVVLLLI